MFYTLIAPWAVGSFAVIAVVSVVAAYWALYRVQAVENRFRGARARYDNVADSLQKLNAARVEHADLINGHENSLRLHGAQLKGAGERIREVEVQLAANSRTIDSILTLGRAPGEAPAGDEARIAAFDANAAIHGLSQRLTDLSTQTFGGRTMDGVPVIGEITHLRQQVEGINSTLGRKIKRLEKFPPDALKSVAGQAARDEISAIRRNSVPARVWRWLTTYSGPGFGQRPFAA